MYSGYLYIKSASYQPVVSVDASRHLTRRVQPSDARAVYTHTQICIYI